MFVGAPVPGKLRRLRLPARTQVVPQSSVGQHALQCVRDLIDIVRVHHQSRDTGYFRQD
jgi:hypothetical protein